jgi:Ring hydroxylating beta subunit
VTNVRTFRHQAAELRVESALLLFRSRGDIREPALISARRTDLLRETGDGLRLTRRDQVRPAGYAIRDTRFQRETGIRICGKQVVSSG